MSEFQKGDRVDYREHRDGEVSRVGRGTVWALFQTVHGQIPIAACASDFRRHIPSAVVRIGEWLLKAPGSRPGLVQIHSALSGEMLETDVAKLEGCLAKFWKKEF